MNRVRSCLARLWRTRTCVTVVCAVGACEMDCARPPPPHVPNGTYGWFASLRAWCGYAASAGVGCLFSTIVPHYIVVFLNAHPTAYGQRLTVFHGFHGYGVSTGFHTLRAKPQTPNPKPQTAHATILSCPLHVHIPPWKAPDVKRARNRRLRASRASGGPFSHCFFKNGAKNGCAPRKRTHVTSRIRRPRDPKYARSTCARVV